MSTSRRSARFVRTGRMPRAVGRSAGWWRTRWPSDCSRKATKSRSWRFWIAACCMRWPWSRRCFPEGGMRLTEMMRQSSHEQIAEFRRRCRPHRLVPDVADDRMAGRIYRLFTGNMRALLNYHPRPYPGRIDCSRPWNRSSRSDSPLPGNGEGCAVGSKSTSFPATT